MTMCDYCGEEFDTLKAICKLCGKLCIECAENCGEAQPLISNNQLQRIIELEAENKRLREAIKRSEDYSRNDNNPTAAHHALVMIEAISTQALSQPTPTTGLLELAVAAAKYTKAMVDPNVYSESNRLEEQLDRFKDLEDVYVEALTPEVRQLLEDMA